LDTEADRSLLEVGEVVPILCCIGTRDLPLEEYGGPVLSLPVIKIKVLAFFLLSLDFSDSPLPAIEPPPTLPSASVFFSFFRIPPFVLSLDHG